MELDRNKIFKLVIVIFCTLAALAVMGTLVQLIQTVLPFLIVGAGIYAAYRWALNDAPPPSADEVEEQARGWFKRFRRGKKAVETTMKAGAVLDEVSEKAEKAEKASKPRDRRAERQRARRQRQRGRAAAPAKAEADVQESRQDDASEIKAALDNQPSGEIAFKDSDVVISKADVEMPDISRLQEKEKETPEVNDAVLAQIEERRRRLNR